MADGNELRRNFEELMVGADKEVESLGMEVQHLAKRRTVG